MTTASVTPSRSPAVQYVLRLADLCLIHAQRLAEWSGHAPILEEDIALTNLSLDLVGQARALLTRAGQVGHGEPGRFDGVPSGRRREVATRHVATVESGRRHVCVT